ncbi:MAG: hypothetical protein U0931_24565 [Vulcanimicrobiota bacterium]
MQIRPFHKVSPRSDPAATARLQKEDDPRLDGCFVGADGQLFTGDSDWKSIPPITPNNGKPARQTLIMINGILSDLPLQMADLQAMANTGCNVIGIHNATRGLLRDLGQCLGDKLDLKMANNGATATTARVVQDLLQEANPPTLVGHSQGALVLSNALKRVEEPLDNLSVVTMAGAAYTFPEGPRYKHYVNRLDIVPMASGVGPYGWAQKNVHMHYFNHSRWPSHLPPTHFGIVNYLARAIDQAWHGAQDVYIPEFGRDNASRP